ncbi:SAM-dependent methyltransferase [Kitasatospora sp. NPDC058965]|uniref:SAM-dependent methyltransferase n=1 Tax=Kitasatospora sp. NPDC058965 TaxID=3346682 RepID=UPI0036BF37B2
MDDDLQPPEVEVNLAIHRPHSARIYDYFLGGTTNFAADREAAAHALAVIPWASAAARVNRAFMHRATRFLAESGVTQFLDIGTGIPTSPNLHEIAQRIDPAARVVYADNDPIVLAHAQALLHSTPEGRTAYVQADVHDPKALLDTVRETGVLDFDRPVALSLVALLHFVPDGAHEIAEVLKAALPAPGSALVISHFTPDFDPAVAGRIEEVYRAAENPVRARTRAEVDRFFDGWQLVEPGIVATAHWRPDPEVPGEPITPGQAFGYAAVAVRG